MSDAIRVNGNLHSWGSIIAKLDGERYYGITAINYADSRERVKGYGLGAHQAPRGRSRGKYTVEPVTLTMYRSSAQLLRDALAQRAPDGISYGDVEFEIVVQTIEPGEVPLTVTLSRCVITGNSVSDSESADPLTEELTIDCMYIYRNKKTLFDSSRGRP